MTPKIILDDVTALACVLADEACVEKLEATADAIGAELFRAGLLRGPGNEAMRTKRLKDALQDCYYEFVESLRLDAAKERIAEMDHAKPEGTELPVYEGPTSIPPGENALTPN